MDSNADIQSRNKELLSEFLTNGLGAISSDFLWAAKHLGLEEWAFTQLQNRFGADSEMTAGELITSVQRNSKRMTVEMSEITELLVSSGYESTMVHGILATLSQAMHGKKIPYSDSKV